jgi:hypothetical protein
MEEESSKRGKIQRTDLTEEVQFMTHQLTIMTNTRIKLLISL